MRKPAGLVAAMVLAALLGACGEPDAERQRPVADTLFLRSPEGVTVLDTGAAPEAEFQAGAAVTSSDWSTVVEADLDHGNTDLIASDPTSGAERWRATLAGRLHPKLLSEEGDLVAVSPIRERHYTQGRTETAIVIAGSGMIKPRSMILDGNYEPEAFSTDGENLFVIKYLPPRNPTKYQVRRLDVDTGRVRPVYTPHEQLQRPMGGTARIQVASPDGRRLYTLYTVGGNDGYAFIHVLALDDMWAHCIALPRDFAKRASAATGLTVSPDGDKVYVANSAADTVAEIDTQMLRVTRSNDVDLIGRGGEIRTAHDSESTFYFSSGKDVTAIDTAELVERTRWNLDGRVTGIQPAGSREKVYIAIRRLVEVIDTDTGDVVEEIDPDGIGRISDLGAGMRSLDSGIVKCAC